MIYRIATYDRKDERIRGFLVIPVAWVSWVKEVAQFGREDDGLGEYLLDEDQIRTLAQQLGFKPEPEHFYYYVEPYVPAEDTGLQPAEATAS